jgi:nicotinate-nucleotide adenylyltransferase
METGRFGDNVRIGVFGGTFDPIHLGHLRLAEEARESFDLRTVYFIPSANPPHKGSASVSQAHHRLNMVEMAVADNPGFEVSDLECRRAAASYSVETLQNLHAEMGGQAELYFLVGLDAFQEIHTWHEYKRLFDLSHWVVFQRPGAGSMGKEALPEEIRDRFRRDPSVPCYEHPSGCRIYFYHFRNLDISGTEIRAKVGRGLSIRYLVPEAVGSYIHRNGLYKTQDRGR